MADHWMIVYNEDNDILAHLDPENAADTLRSFLTWTVEPLPIGIWELLCATPDICHYESKVGEVRRRRLMPQIVSHMTDGGGHEQRGSGKVPRHDWHKAYGLEFLRLQGLDPLTIHIEVLSSPRHQGAGRDAHERYPSSHDRSAAAAGIAVSSRPSRIRDQTLRRHAGDGP